MGDQSLWLALIGLGAFHGLNPAMGWLFSVALGLQHRSRITLLWSLLPIALGHAISIGGIVLLSAFARRVVEANALRWTAAGILIAFGLYRLVARHSGRATGMQVGFLDLSVWSFLMATGHGAGLMLLPILLRLPIGGMQSSPVSMGTGVLLVVAVHTLAMLAVAGAIALVVYDWFGLAFLRRGWINLDLVWAIALLVVGSILLAPSLPLRWGPTHDMSHMGQMEVSRPPLSAALRGEAEITEFSSPEGAR